MAAPRKDEMILSEVRRYLAEAENSSPEEWPIEKKAIAAAASCSRTTLDKYIREGLLLEKEFEKAAAKQAKNASSSPRKKTIRAYGARIEALKTELKEAREQNLKLLEQIRTIEANLRETDVNPEVLYRPLRRPDYNRARAPRRARRPAFR